MIVHINVNILSQSFIFIYTPHNVNSSSFKLAIITTGAVSFGDTDGIFRILLVVHLNLVVHPLLLLSFVPNDVMDCCCIDPLFILLFNEFNNKLVFDPFILLRLFIIILPLICV